jgi:hypothetical protein
MDVGHSYRPWQEQQTGADYNKGQFCHNRVFMRARWAFALDPQSC